jgi:hypothetical protein
MEAAMRTVAVILSTAAVSLTLAAPSSPPLNRARIEELTGAKGSYSEKEGVFKVSVPRADLSITAAGVKITPALGLTSWAAFKKAGERTMVGDMTLLEDQVNPVTRVMGDMVLLEDQVNPVMSVALDNGLEVTALHNHFLGENPRVMFMHISGVGSEERLASAVGKVFSMIEVTARSKPKTRQASIDPAKTTLDSGRIEAILGERGELKNGVYKITIGRETSMHGIAMGTTMGVNTWAAFAGADDLAVVDGDFAVLEFELQGVLKALRGAGIDIVAIHQHMSGETPRILFLHYWGIGRTVDLAKGLRLALDAARTSAKH